MIRAATRARTSGDVGHAMWAPQSASAAASITVEAFGLNAIAVAERAELDRRAAWLDARVGTGQAARLYEGR